VYAENSSEIDHGPGTRQVRRPFCPAYSSTKVFSTLRSHIYFSSNHFIPIERETTRKKYIESLENRTPEQIEEENALYVEIKRLEQRERRFKKEREDLLRTLLGVESGLADVVIDDDGTLMAANTAVDGKKKKKGNDLDSPSTPVMPSPSGSVPPAKRSTSAKSTAYGGFGHFVSNLRADC
jgi:hypothetical protein